MTTLEDRFQRGLEIRAQFAGGEGRTFPGSVPVAYELAPDMYRIATECLYGSIWSRPGLDIKLRFVASLTAAAMRRAETPGARLYTQWVKRGTDTRGGRGDTYADHVLRRYIGLLRCPCDGQGGV